jgi:hypothetical protein
MSNPPLPTGFQSTTQSPIKKGGELNGTKQPDWSISDDGKGMLTGTMRFFYSTPTGKPTQTVVQAGAPHPRFPSLLCNSVTTTLSSNDISYVEAQYVGLSRDPAGVDWTMNTPTEEEPIENHPDFGDSAKGWGVVTQDGVSAETGIPYWNRENVVVDKDGVFEKFKYNPANVTNQFVGVTSYKACRATVSVTYFTANQGTVNVAVGKLATISDPFVSVPINKKADQNFLCTSVSVTQYSATIYQISEEYQLSGLKGWNKKIYAD